MNKESKGEEKKVLVVQVVFTSRAWMVFDPRNSNPIAAAYSGQDLVEQANSNRWSIQNRDNIIPHFRSQLLY